MKASVSSRNLIGGFFGGVIGILASGLLSPLVMPFGVLLGVVVGWWNEDLLRLLGEAHQQAKKASSGFVGMTDSVVLALTRLCGLPTKIAGMFRWIVVKMIVGTIITIVSAPVRFWKWQASHLMNRANTISLLTFLLFILAVPVLMWFAEPYLGIEGEGNRGVLALLGFIVTMGGAIVYRMSDEISQNAELHELRRYYREWEVIDRYGSFGFFLYDLGMQVRYTIGVMAFFAIAAPWFIVSMTVGLIVVYPLLMVIAVARGFYQIATLSAHWLCFGVTMIVTMLSWFFYHESFVDTRVLWMIALGTGIVSGGVTEIVRLVLLKFYVNTSIGRILAEKETAWELVFDEEKGYIGIVMFKFSGLWFRQNRLVRMFRAVCLGTPVAQPVLI